MRRTGMRVVMTAKTDVLALSYLHVIPGIVESNEELLGEEPGVYVHHLRSHVGSDFRIGIDRNDRVRDSLTDTI